MGQLEMEEKDKRQETLEARFEGNSGVFSVSVGGWYSIGHSMLGAALLCS